MTAIVPTGDNEQDALNLEVHCGLALAEHYSDIPWQTFHHEPSVAAVVLDAVPDGWAKINGEWVSVNGRCSTCGGSSGMVSIRETDGTGGHMVKDCPTCNGNGRNRDA